MTNSLNIETLSRKAETLGHNQSSIAKTLGVSRETVSQWFKQEKYPRPDKLLKLARLLERPKLLPPGCEAQRLSAKDTVWIQPGTQGIAVTTDADFYEEHADSVEFWSPGSPAFPLQMSGDGDAAVASSTLGELLER